MRIFRLSEDGGPLSVFFKLPISEISEIDDHKSVRIFIFLVDKSVRIYILEDHYETYKIDDNKSVCESSYFVVPSRTCLSY